MCGYFQSALKFISPLRNERTHWNQVSGRCGTLVSKPWPESKGICVLVLVQWLTALWPRASRLSLGVLVFLCHKNDLCGLFQLLIVHHLFSCIWEIKKNFFLAVFYSGQCGPHFFFLITTVLMLKLQLTQVSVGSEPFLFKFLVSSVSCDFWFFVH